VRVKIVINHRGHDRAWHAATILRKLAYFGTRAWDTLAGWIRFAWRHLREGFCGLSGHQDILHLRRQRLSLCCSRCGRVTRGWDLTDPTPSPGTGTERPRYLELARRRSS
jgi:hypothetical protein